MQNIDSAPKNGKEIIIKTQDGFHHIVSYRFLSGGKKKRWFTATNVWIHESTISGWFELVV